MLRRLLSGLLASVGDLGELPSSLAREAEGGKAEISPICTSQVISPKKESIQWLKKTL